MQSTSLGSPLPLALAACTPLIFAGGALLGARANPLRTAERASSLAFALAATSVATLTFLPTSSASGSLLSLDWLTASMLLLVCGIGAVIARFSRTYLRGELGTQRYATALLGTLSAVSTFVLANQLLLIAVAWLAASLCLHQLLTFYPNRTQALLAAHKKFILSRVADVSFAVAVGLIAIEVGRLELDALEQAVASWATLPPRLEVAAALIVLTVVLKSAQLPFHGWLIQVMEAPTPVSALLHAGVVNLGGFLLIRMHVLLEASVFAQLLLVVVGTATAVLAALIMMTRVSVKVAFAWSTCAQMGFMLLECGLGAWRFALLHLFAHSLYKAHAFLSAASRVAAWRAQALVEARATTLRRVWVTALALFVGLLGASALLKGELPSELSFVGWTLVFSLGLAPLAAQGSARRSVAVTGLRVLALGCLFLVLHELLPHEAAATSPVRGLAWALVVLAFVVAFALQSVLLLAPESRLARTLQPYLFAGLYLDEWFTCMTMRIWPPANLRHQPHRIQQPLEVGQ